MATTSWDRWENCANLSWIFSILLLSSFFLFRSEITSHLSGRNLFYGSDTVSGILNVIYLVAGREPKRHTCRAVMIRYREIAQSNYIHANQCIATATQRIHTCYVDPLNKDLIWQGNIDGVSFTSCYAVGSMH